MLGVFLTRLYFSYLVAAKPVAYKVSKPEADNLFAMINKFGKQQTRSKWPVFDYRDELPLVLGALLMAGLCCYYASKVGLLVGMTTTVFYLSYFLFLFFIGIAFAFIRREIRVLDGTCNWLANWPERLVFQAVYCWLAPGMALFLVYIAAHRFLGVAVLTSGLFEVDLPWILALLLLVNVLYILAFFVELHKRNQRKRHKAVQRHRLAMRGLQQETAALKAQLEDLQSNVVPPLLHPPEAAAKRLDSVYEIHLRNSVKKFLYSEIACFSYEKPYTYLTTIQGQKVPAKEASLLEVEEATQAFFRKVTRAIAVPQHILLACKRIEDGKLELQLKEPLTKRDVKVSKEAAPRLRSWILEAVEKIE